MDTWTEETSEAIARVGRAADAEWKAEAREAVLKLAAKREFTSPEVWETGLPKPREARALGAVIIGLLREGLLVNTGRYVLAAEGDNHATPRPILRLA